jgi:hypothetical protein
VQTNDAGDYIVRVTNSIGEASSVAAELTVLATPQIETIGGYGATLPGTSLNFTAVVRGTQPISYQWQFNGHNLTDDGRISGAASPQLTMDAVTYAGAGDYSLVATNDAGSVTGLVMRLAVTPIVAWGDDAYGQLHVPLQATNVIAVSAGDSHSLALQADGTVLAWGDNTYGQATPPTLATNVVGVSVGRWHSLALSGDGRVLAWGDNSYGQCSVPPQATNSVAVAAGASHSVVLLSDGRVIAWGDNSSKQTNTPTGIANSVAIAAGDYFSMALLADGSLQTWGEMRATNAGIVLCAGSSGHRLGLQADGRVLAWGRNYFGQAAPPTSADGAVAVAAGGDHSLALSSAGEVLAWGASYRGQAGIPEAAKTNIVAIAAGGAHSLGLSVASGRAPTIEASPRTVILGEDAILLAVAPGVRGTAYQWEFNGAAIPNATNLFLPITGAHWTNAGAYRVAISNVFGAYLSFPTTISILRTPLRFDVSPETMQWTTNGMQLRLLGASGLAPVVVYVTTDFASWLPVYTNPPIIGAFSLLDLGSSNRPQTFYRASEGSPP